MWESGCAPAADRSIYVCTGNGTYDPPRGDFGDSVLQLARRSLQPERWYTPPDQALLDRTDMDLGSGGVVLLPDEAGSHEHHHLLICGGKEGNILLLDRDRLGGRGGVRWRPLEVLDNSHYHGLYSVPAYFDGAVYFCRVGDALEMHPIHDARLAVKPSSQTSVRFGYPGCSPSISADGTRNGIVWAIERGSPSVLRAYDAHDLARELYASTTPRDALGTVEKFAVPTVANGKVYVGTADGLVVYGLR